MRSTALKQFQRLEASGQWQAVPDAQPREVIVSIGEATLILSDPGSDAPLAHWSLPAVERANPGQMPARYRPAAAEAAGSETLVLDDVLMIEAIDRVQSAIAARRAHPGRVRGGLTVAVLLALIVAAAVWLPPALRDHAVRITPAAERGRIGAAILSNMAPMTGPACSAPAGQAALHRLAARTGLPDPARLVVLPDGMAGARMLPGGIVAISADLVTGRSGPEALAGHLLAARLSAETHDPMDAVMRQARINDVLALLTSGALPEHALSGISAAIWAVPPPMADEHALLEAFGQTRIPSGPFADTLAEGNRASVPLSESDPFRSDPYPPLMSERDWVALQQICTVTG
ncbi:hypothetical protein SAMN05421538_104208 [Paracoccus isoporae]|uniref:Uncharacterized protein n=1 Tax=Paracoccus isoporae TaxID=591205 RepID=A0A1G7AP43_9RHOB|nr:hypothetical protein [Paracoccus isoporae]SDE16639.1 hypothetical protein SAMN05421538_104208 [Paracoccus isoporae]